MKSVAFIGTGLMGRPMAANVMEKGFPITVYNRTKEKTKQLVSAGARLAENPRQAAEESDVVITMLSNIEAVESVLSGEHGLIRALGKDKVFIDMSTITPAASRKFSELVEATGAKMLDAPVVGTSSVAEKGELSILVGGDPRVLDDVRDIFHAMGKFIFHVGDHGSACGMKLVVNHFISGMIGLLAEGLELSEKLGIDSSVFSNVLNTSAVKSPVYELRAPKMMAGDHATQFPIRLLVKDLNYITQTAEKVGAVMPMHSLVRDLFSLAATYGYAEQDISAIYEMFDRK
ncbi:MAG: NAD(P)-dependent oxidoreductase [Bacteroidetes bacterium]|nr:NAD(P)-dependent oxidoreductase [Bacteroidota bacterium]